MKISVRGSILYRTTNKGAQVSIIDCKTHALAVTMRDWYNKAVAPERMATKPKLAILTHQVRRYLESDYWRQIDNMERGGMIGNINKATFLMRKSALKLETMGLRFKRGSVYAMCKREYNIKGSKQRVLDQMNEYADKYILNKESDR